ncbi:NAD(P)-binding protein [Ceraceosorus guamensis]|uniref:NAD(P)-binding protein n=1 Tax=Ceraceosorus guamensis TaxID=1522189 RepID=A0A316VUZ1_9BASI|nr:NAD(P)-binding protein [Ceraceosorus guamensis]PWN40243.1 NAD(P)-binding protein [Ceraceosorus guamensis]
MKSRVGGQRITLAKREARNGQSDDDSGRQLASLFTLESFDIDAFPTSLKKGEIRCRILCLNIEPALRAWLTTAAVAYADAVRVGDVIRSAGVALVTESRCPKFRAGDHVYGLVGWQSHAIFQVASHGQHLILCDTRIQRQVQNYEEALAVWSSILSHTGLTAYLGLVDFGRIQRGHRVLITNAAGGVGTIAVQIAKLKGAHVVATAGSDAKIKWLKDVLGVDVALDYRTVSNPDLRRAFNPGLDIILDNAGGRVLDQALLALSPGARVALSGFMTAYKSTEPRGLTNMYRVIETGSTVQGLLVTGEIMESHTKAKEDLYEWFRQGALRPIVNVRRGLEQCPLCFQSLFEVRKLDWIA